MRRKRDALRYGGMVMLDTTNPSVLSYVRTAPPGHPDIVVSLNMTAQPQTIALDLTKFSTLYSTNYVQMLAMAVIASLPVLVVFTIGRRQIINSLMLSGLKG